jgi:hypothetical protein
MISNAPLEARVRYAAALAIYGWLWRRRNIDATCFHHTNSYCTLLTQLAKQSKEKEPEIYSESNPLICVQCGKQVGTHYSYAKWQHIGRMKRDCCNAMRGMPQAAKPLESFLFFQPDFTLHDCMGISREVAIHYITLELRKYYKQREDKIKQLSRYYDEQNSPRTSIAGFSIVQSLG